MLACCLISQDALIVAIERIQDDAVFFDLRHRTLWETMVSMWKEKIPIDIITLIDRLKSIHMLDMIGGMEYILPLPDTVASAAEIDHYLSIIIDKHQLRRTIKFCTEQLSAAYDGVVSAPAFLDEFERGALQVRLDAPSNESSTKLIVEAVCTELETAMQNQGKLVGLPTGYQDLDRRTAGLNPGDYIVLAGRPSTGKTSLAINIASALAVKERIPIGIFSLEMTATKLVKRIASGMAHVDSIKMADGTISPDESARIVYALGKISKAPLHIVDGSTTIMKLCAKARRMVKQFGLRMLVIDYLQLIALSGRFNNQNERLTEISTAIKGLSGDLNIPVIAISQLNRDSVKDGNRPGIHHLREGGNLEGDADVIILIHDMKEQLTFTTRGRQYDAAKMEVNVAKNRNGPTGETEMMFVKPFTLYQQLCKIDESDIPQT